MSAWLVVGLGNPGERYASTRHNIGARVVERLAERLGERFRKARFLPLLVAEAKVDGERVWLVRPMTFMNISGPPVASFARRHRIGTDRIVVCQDEIDLAFGSLRLKQGGSTAGHRGLDSLSQALRTKDFYRVRLGVGRPPGRKEAADHVLDTFAKREREDVELLIEDAADAVLALIREGLATAQDRFNRRGG
ncbi:MAG TPA: aminoacyl-tRNA hydrolase [Actinomycetota bacterium]|nr:aminoacyl-tRNA hydrolase [Actinomycetota bacterium]